MAGRRSSPRRHFRVTRRRMRPRLCRSAGRGAHLRRQRIRVHLTHPAVPGVTLNYAIISRAHRRYRRCAGLRRDTLPVRPGGRRPSRTTGWKLHLQTSPQPGSRVTRNADARRNRRPSLLRADAALHFLEPVVDNDELPRDRRVIRLGGEKSLTVSSDVEAKVAAGANVSGVVEEEAGAAVLNVSDASTVTDIIAVPWR